MNRATSLRCHAPLTGDVRLRSEQVAMVAFICIAT
jgi:hypothetical protein